MQQSHTINEAQWEFLVNVLRKEIEEYSVLLGLLTDQQERILGNDPEGIAELSHSINQQMEITQKIGKEREGYLQKLAAQVGLCGVSSIQTLMQYFPEYVQGLLTALIEEGVSIMPRIHRKANQNQRLLMRAYETVEYVMRTIHPEAMTKTYTKKGSVHVQASTEGKHMSTSV